MTEGTGLTTPNGAQTTCCVVWAQVVFYISILYTNLCIYYRFIYESTAPWLHAMTEVTGLRTADCAQTTRHVVWFHVCFLYSLYY